MTDGGIYTSYYFIKRLGSGQAESLDLDFFYHLESPSRRLQWQKRRPVRRRRCSSRPKRLQRPKVTAVVDVEIHSSARWQALPRRHCSVFHYIERRRDSVLDSCRRSRSVSWRVPL